MRLLKLFCLAGLLALGAGVTAPVSEANPYSSRQYYSSWKKHTSHNYHYRTYYYKPHKDYYGYKHQYVMYYPSRKYNKHYYYYNPYKKVYWGRCPTHCGGTPQYSELAEKDRKGELGEISESAFPPPGKMAPMPESTDGATMDLRLKTLFLHWGAADAGSHLEHNVIVVTALDQDFHQGFIIDGWRNAGRLCWWPVLQDSSYRWKEDLQETTWLHDYELVQPSPVQSKTAVQSKPAIRQKIVPIQPKPQKATASLEIQA